MFKGKKKKEKKKKETNFRKGKNIIKQILLTISDINFFILMTPVNSRHIIYRFPD